METYAKGASPEEMRDRICRSKGILGGFRTAHNIIARSTKDPQKLLKKGLDAEILKELGYTDQGMKALGYSDDSLATLGYIQKTNQSAQTKTPAKLEGEVGLRELIESGENAGRIQSAGFTIHHCKAAGYDARDVARLGFELPQLALVYSPVELRNAGFGIQEMQSYFDCSEIKSAGFSSKDFKNAGFAISDLLNFGFSENHVRTAGYSNNELAREGLMRQTVDRVRGPA